MEHMAYLVPFNRELVLPYRAPKQLKEMIRYMFSHPTVPKAQRQLFIDVSSLGSRTLLNDMGRVAIAMCQYFVDHPNQFGGAMENIQFQVIRRMWHQVFNHMFKQGRMEHLKDDWVFLRTSMKLLAIENGFWEELLRVVNEKDYDETNDSMVKRREGVELRGRRNAKQHNPASLLEGKPYFEYLAGLS